MAAGLGFKTFTTGEVLTAADTNGYLMQGINVFASAAARDAAITSPQEGQFAFTKDTNGLWYYDGAAWVASGATGDIEGVTAGIGISGGGTSGTVTVTNSMATAITTNGDIIYGTGSGTFTRRGIGSTGQVLTVSGGVPTWATAGASAETFTLINTGGTALSGGTTTVTGISGKNTILIYVVGASRGTGGGSFDMRFNSDTGNNYNQYGLQKGGTSAEQWNTTNVNYIRVGDMGSSADAYIDSVIMLHGCNSSGIKPFQHTSSGNYATSNVSLATSGIYAGTSTISSVSIINGSGTFDAGTIYIYGA